MRKSCREGGSREVKSQVYTGSETRASNVVYSRSDSSSSSEREQTTLVPVLKVKRATCAQRQRVGSPDDGKGGGEERCGGEALTERKRESDSDTLAQLSQLSHGPLPTATWLCLLSHQKSHTNSWANPAANTDKNKSRPERAMPVKKDQLFQQAHSREETRLVVGRKRV